MRRKTKTYNKLSKVLAELGCEQQKDGTFHSFEKDHIDYLVYVDEEEESFCLIETITGFSGELSKEQFDIAMDVVQHFHKDYDGYWNEGTPYISSPTYCLKRFRTIPKDQMEKIIINFFEAFAFMCANAYLLTDDTIPQ